MTKETLLQELSDKIREVCPELMDLSLGCEILTPPMGIGAPERENSWHIVAEPPYDGKVRVIGRSHRISLKSITKVIGHPIQLQHILRAMMAKSGSDSPGRRLLLLEAYGLNDISKAFEEWSVETLQFLHDIICK